ncbi:MAG: beta-hydroxyacyl-ACP dehydratase [Pyrinomonadaceae bacterium]|nr:beta-hydroxyacyl-ACP dehydratase [Phycisphaerales bacterium]
MSSVSATTDVSSETASGSERTGFAAKPLLFDLGGIDLNARLLSKPDLERWNPHRGAMALLDHVVWRTPDFTRGVGLKLVKDDEFWVPGHFPDKALMPGVLMIETGAQLASYLYNSRFTKPKLPVFIRIEEASFRSPVVPGDELFILCRDLKFAAKRFISDIQGIVNGKIAFEARITGMAAIRTS